MTALFVGLCTLDVIQLVPHVPGSNEKLTAHRQTIAAGGPATNAAVTCSHLGHPATLVTAIGSHPLAAGIHADLDAQGVTIVDMDAASVDPPTVSSILVTESTGDRAVASTNAAGRGFLPPANLDALVADASVVEVDGHHIAVAREAVRLAHADGRVTLLDGGSWKPGTRELLRHLDVVVCSADFRPPGMARHHSIMDFLLDPGVRYAAITHGGGPILWRGKDGRGEVAVPATAVADTLGAGDVFHGALAFALAQHPELSTDVFVSALNFAAGIAAHSCTSFGTRTWLRS